MSVLAEVLSSHENVSIETINNELPKLTADIGSLKRNLLKFMEEVHITSLLPKEVRVLQVKLNKLIEKEKNTQNLYDTFKKGVKDTKSKVLNYDTNFSKIKVMLKLCADIGKIYDGLTLIKNGDHYTSYVTVVKELKEINLSLEESDIPENEFQIVSSLMNNFIQKKEKYLKKLFGIVNNHFICTKTEGDPIIIKISVKKENEEVQQALEALALYERIDQLNFIISFLWNNIFVQVVNHTSNISVEENDGFTLTLKIKPKFKDGYSVVFAKLMHICEFLYAHFNYNLYEDFTMMDYIGADIRDNLAQLIIKNCLDEAIPSTAEGLEKFNEVIACTKVLQERLIKTRIFAKDSTSILEHAENIDVLFINKKCQEYKSLAIELMQKDLHDVVTVGTECTDFVSQNFGQCAVSKSVVELLELLEKILEKAKNSEISAGRLYITAQNIIYMYGPTVTDYHHNLLQSIPQQVAIFYNNCTYLDYEIVSKGLMKDFKKLPVLKNEVQAPFEGYQTNLVSGAEQMFEEYIATQIKQIETTVKESGILDLLISEKLPPTTEKAIRQCLRQQELLKTVWQKILNNYMYNKTIGVLLNTLSNSLINSILQLQDIASEASEQLVDIFKVVLTRGPKLFTDPKEINIYVQSWHKLSELVFVLNGNLASIKDRWAEGKGILALHFKPEEMRGLIKALFMNSDLRASVLAELDIHRKRIIE